MKTTILRPPLKYPGGKFYLARRYTYPPHETFVDATVGGGSALLQKVPAKRELAFDIDPLLIKFWRGFRSEYRLFKSVVSQTPYRESEFLSSKKLLESSVAEQLPDGFFAAHYMIVSRFSRGGLRKDFAWSKRLRGGRPGDENAWDTIRGQLDNIHSRIRQVEFVCGDCRDLIPQYDSPHTLTLVDPPYMFETRVSHDLYRHETSRGKGKIDADRLWHASLLRVLIQCQGPVMLCGYDNPLYRQVLAGWDRQEFSIANHCGQTRTKQRRTEVLWTKR